MALAELCVKCGAHLPVFTASAPAPIRVEKVSNPDASPKSRTVMAILAWFTGFVGVHRFYAGRIPSGVTMALVWTIGMGIYIAAIIAAVAAGTLDRTASLTVFEAAVRTAPGWPVILLMATGGLMITGMEVWRLVDFAMILLGKFRDGAGKVVTRWVN
jgi:TM2 domain-containing membrane protein YozV